MVTVTINNQNITLNINASLINQETETFDDTRRIDNYLFYDKVKNMLYKYKIEIYTNYITDEEGNIISDDKTSEIYSTLEKEINLNNY